MADLISFTAFLGFPDPFPDSGRYGYLRKELLRLRKINSLGRAPKIAGCYGFAG
jgi:hypothetical protein